MVTTDADSRRSWLIGQEKARFSVTMVMTAMDGSGGSARRPVRAGANAVRLQERRQRRGHVEGLDGLVATAAYQPEPTAAAAARRFVRDTLQTWFISGAATGGDGLVDDAVLLTSELVTNAVVHAGTPVEVTCKLTGGGVEVVVSDGHPARLVPEPPENEHIPAERASGRGLLLPAALASAWGVTYGQAAKAVWFRIGQQGSGLEPGPGGEQENGLRPVLSQAPVLNQIPAAPVKVGAGAPTMNGTHRWP